MEFKRISLKRAIDFHGHLGPYLILGILAGEWAIKKFRCRKYFDLHVKVWGVNKKPRSCLIDGLQLSTGATYGKGNIEKFNSSGIKIDFYHYLNAGGNSKVFKKENKVSCGVNHKKITLRFKSELIQKLKETKTHRDSEILAKKLYTTDYNKLFKLQFALDIENVKGELSRSSS